MPESKQDGYLNRFIEDESAPETKTMAVRIYLAFHLHRGGDGEALREGQEEGGESPGETLLGAETRASSPSQRADNPRDGGATWNLTASSCPKGARTGRLG